MQNFLSHFNSWIKVRYAADQCAIIGADLEYEYIHAPLHVDQTIAMVRRINAAGEVIDPRPKVIGNMELDSHLIAFLEGTSGYGMVEHLKVKAHVRGWKTEARERRCQSLLGIKAEHNLRRALLGAQWKDVLLVPQAWYPEHMLKYETKGWWFMCLQKRS